ncbi:MAG: hypothetical protein ACR2LV_05350 [Solirubrobacteraceae bacterium]
MGARAPVRWIIALELGVLYLILNGGGWVYDDNFELVNATQSGFNWHWLDSVIIGHWEIGGHLLISAQDALMPLDYRWALVAMLAVLGVSVYLFERTMQMLVGRGWVSLLAAAYLGISVLLVRPLQWWSFGIEALPNVLFDLLVLYAYLRFSQTNSWRWAAASAGAMAVGLLFYEKVGYTFLYLWLLQAFFLAPSLRPRELLRSFWAQRSIWVAYGLVLVLWAIGYKAAGGILQGSLHSAPSLHGWLTYLRVLWFQTLVPALFGLTLPAGGLSPGQVWLAAGLQLLLVAAIVLSLVRKPSAWRAWISLTVCVAATVALVGQSRIVPIGAASTGNDPRYLLDFAWLVPLMASLAFSRRERFALAGSGPAPAARGAGVTAPVPASRWASGLLLSAGLAVILYLSASIVTAAKLQRHWAGHQARVWEQNVQSGLRAIERTGSRPVLADNLVPPEIVAAAFVNYNRISGVVPHYDARAQVDGTLAGPLVMLDADGTVRQARVIGTGEAIRLGSHKCYAAGSHPVQIQARLAPWPDPSGEPYYLRLRYQLAERGELGLFVDHGHGYPGTPDPMLRLVPGAHGAIAWLGDGSLRGLVLQIPSFEQICLEQPQVLTLRPAN